MALHSKIGDLVIEAIDEYIEAAHRCLETVKTDGGCLGFPATLLLMCVVDAMGRYLRDEPVTIEGKEERITRGEPFRVFNHALFGLDLSHAQIKTVEDSFRNRLAHNALIDPDCYLRPGIRSRPFEFREDGSIVIWVKTFHGMVNTAWEEFDETKLHDGAENLMALKNPIRE